MDDHATIADSPIDDDDSIFENNPLCPQPQNPVSSYYLAALASVPKIKPSLKNSLPIISNDNNTKGRFS